MTDKEWAFFEPLVMATGGKSGRPPEDHRQVLDGVFWIARTGAPWRDRQVVIGVPAVPALDVGWHLVADAASLERERGPTEARADDRLHHRAGAPSGGRRKRGTQREGFGRSKGGFTTKIQLRTNAEGLPIAAGITGGEVSDYKGYDLVMDADAPDPKVLIADKGYDADRIREPTEAAASQSSRCVADEKSKPRSMTTSTPSETASSAASTSSRTRVAWQPATTKPPQAISDSFTSSQRACGPNTLSTRPSLPNDMANLCQFRNHESAHLA